jgi:putative copper export protein
MSGPADLVLAVLVRWIGLVALAGLVGSLAVRVIVLPPDVPALERRLGRWTRVCNLLLLVVGAADLFLRARTMAGGDLAAALSRTPVVLTRTHFGAVWSIRVVALVLLLGLAGRSGRTETRAAYALSLVVALTTTLAGHAADRGDLSANALIDWVHVAAATTWTGGLLWLAVVVLREGRAWSRERLAALLRRFSALAAWCLAAVVASGIYNAVVQLGSLDAFWTTAYGATLAVKLALVLAVVSIGAINRFVVLPELGVGPPARTARPLRAASPTPPALDRLGAYVAREAALALVVLGCTALLGESAPPHHRHAAGTGSQATVSRFASATNCVQESAHALHTAWVPACLRHSFSQSSQMSRQAVANSPSRVAFRPRQCARPAWPSATQARAASTRP